MTSWAALPAQSDSALGFSPDVSDKPLAPAQRVDAGELLRAVAPALWAARAVGLLTYRLRPQPSSAPAPAFALCKASAAYAALLCGWVSAVIVYCALDYNAQMEAWSRGLQVGEAAMWLEGPAPQWLPLLQFKVNFNFAAHLAAVPLLQAVALRAQPRVARLLRRARALVLRLGGEAARRVCARLRTRLRVQMAAVLALTLFVRCAPAFVMLPYMPLLIFTGVFSGVVVSLVTGFMYIQFSNFAFVIRSVYAFANGRLAQWGEGSAAPEGGQKAILLEVPPGQESACACACLCAEGVRAAARLLGEACDAACALDAVSGPGLLLLVLSVYLNVACMLYYAVLTYAIEYHEMVNTPIWDVVSLVWLVSYPLVLALVLKECEALVAEANKSGALVHNLLLSSKDPLVRHELQLLSLQLLHRRVRFSACGFFPLDFSLLYSIVGAVTTYLVILIQIQLSIGSNKQK